MFRFLLRRLGMVMPTFLGITILAFALIHLIPGDPVEVMLGERGAILHISLPPGTGLDWIYRCRCNISAIYQKRCKATWAFHWSLMSVCCRNSSRVFRRRSNSRCAR